MTRSLTGMRSKTSGQTLIIALILLGILLVFGFIFLGVVSRNIVQQATQARRTLATDLAEAGIRYAHSQLVNSELGADWRGTPTPVSSTKDPDYDLLGKPDGPDGHGAFTRVNFENGRALIRVRYTAADPSIFNISADPGANLAKPLVGARSYLIIESYGRPGRVNASDPTAVYASSITNQRKIVAMVSIGPLESALYITNKYRVSRAADLGVPSELGLMYSGSQVQFPLDIGSIATLPNFGATAPGTTTQVGSGGSIFSNADLKIHGGVNIYLAPPLGEQIDVAGSIIGANSSATNPSTLNLFLSSAPNGVWNSPSTPSATLTDNTSPSLNSQSDDFDTFSGALRDGADQTDANGFARAVGYKTPPSIQVADPDTGILRYVKMTKESGNLVSGSNAGNSGRFGYGRGIYVDNFDDLQIPSDEPGRANVGSSQSLIYDWLNPNNGQSNSGWQGPFYVPRGAYVRLTSDGFTITRDSRSNPDRRTWKNPDGTDTGSTTIKYRFGYPVDGSGNAIRDAGGKPLLYVVNTYTPGVDINAPPVDQPGTHIDYSLGEPFNGVLYFEGNVRIRGQIPTDVPLLVVSNATIYIEGSITKGIVGNDYTYRKAGEPDASDGISPGSLLTHPSSASIGLFAKDYVAVNTTQFFGPDPNQTLEPVNDVPSAVGFSPVRMRDPGNSISFLAELLLDPNSYTGANPYDATTWTPYSLGYKDASTATPLSQDLVLTHTMDDGPAPNTFISLNVNPGVIATQPGLPSLYAQPYPAYLFPESLYNSATAYYAPSYVPPGFAAGNNNPPDGYLPMYGLGSESWQRYSKFESTNFPLFDDQSSYSLADTNTPPFLRTITAPRSGTNFTGAVYYGLGEETNQFQIYPNSVGSGGTNDYLLARAALVPNDVRIEAAIFAEDGSFFVIPGPWFNPNPNDTRDNYASLGADDAERQLARYEAFGAGPTTPFYDEPLDVRIQIFGSVSENMPPPISQQAEYLKKWGWIPISDAATGHDIPGTHVPAGTNLATATLVPNLTIAYDPMLGTGHCAGDFDEPPVRTDGYGRTLPPLPRLPVSPVLSYFGEVNP